MQLGKYFTLEEVTRSRTARLLKVENNPNAEQIENLRALVKQLDWLREYIGRPIVVTSGYRNHAVNRAVGGSKNSDHLRGQAADIHVPGWSTQKLFDTIRQSGIVFDQLIQEFDSWVHISYDRKYNKRQASYAYYENGEKKIGPEKPKK